MHSFFDSMEPWRRPEGSLHFYVLPDDDAVDALSAVQGRLRDVRHLPLMPAPYLHCTVQRLSQFDDDVAQGDYSRLGDAMTAFCATQGAFDLTLRPPGADEVAVGCWAEPSAQWDALVEGCRDVAVRTWGIEPPAAPVAPHLSLAYATGPVDAGDVEGRLAESREPIVVHVDRVHLVSVTVRPARGTFDFTSLANWDLKGARA